MPSCEHWILRDDPEETAAVFGHPRLCGRTATWYFCYKYEGWFGMYDGRAGRTALCDEHASRSIDPTNEDPDRRAWGNLADPVWIPIDDYDALAEADTGEV